MKRTLALFTVLLAFAIFVMPTYAGKPDGPPDPYVMPVKVVNDPFCIDILFGQYQFNFHHTGFFEYHSNTIGLPDEYRVVIEQVLSEIIVPSNTTSVVANIKVVSTTSTGFFIQTFPLLVTDQGTDHEGNKIMIISQLMKLNILPIAQAESKEISIQLKVYSANDDIDIQTLGNIVTSGYYDRVP